MVRPPEGMGTISEPFAPHPYVIVAAPDHPLARRRKIPLASLAHEPFVVREKGSDTRNSMEEGLGRRLKNFEIAMEIKSTETIKQAVIAGMGISFLSAHTISLELRVGALSILDIRGFPLMLNWYVVHRENKRLPPVALAFKSFLMRDGAVTDRVDHRDPRPAPQRGRKTIRATSIEELDRDRRLARRPASRADRATTAYSAGKAARPQHDDRRSARAVVRAAAAAR
jgi:hypothetical protein